MVSASDLMAFSGLKITDIAPKEVIQATLGAVGGTIGAAVILVPKMIVGLSSAFTSGGGNEGIRIVMGVIDGGIGGWALYHSLTAPKRKLEPFWRGAEGAFGVWETLYGVLETAGAVGSLITKR